jgi:hypothetical protein
LKTLRAKFGKIARRMLLIISLLTTRSGNDSLVEMRPSRQTRLGPHDNCSDGRASGYQRGSASAILPVFEAAGVIFVDENGEAPAVRLRKPPD